MTHPRGADTAKPATTQPIITARPVGHPGALPEETAYPGALPPENRPGPWKARLPWAGLSVRRTPRGDRGRSRRRQGPSSGLWPEQEEARLSEGAGPPDARPR